MHLLGAAGGRICIIEVVLGTYLTGNAALPAGGVLPLLRQKFAQPQVGASGWRGLGLGMGGEGWGAGVGRGGGAGEGFSIGMQGSKGVCVCVGGGSA
jgi:hypothetical protein